MTNTSAFTPQELLLRNLLRLVAIATGLLSLSQVFPNAEASSGAALLSMLAWFASADVRRFRAFAWLTCAGLGLLALFFLIFALEIPASLPAGLTAPAVRPALLLWLAVTGLSALLILVIILRTDESLDTVFPWKTQKPQTPSERAARLTLAVLSFAALVTAFLLLYAPSTLPEAERAVSPLLLWAPAAALFFVLLALCGGLFALNPRRYGESLTLILVGLVLAILNDLLNSSSAVGVLTAVAAQGGISADPLSPALSGLTLAYALIIIGLWVLRGWLHRSLLDYLRFFTPGQFWALAAIADGLIEGGPRERLKPHEIALRVDGHLASFPAPKLGLSRLILAALDILFPFLFNLRPPLSFMHLNERTEFLNTLFKVDLVEERGLFWLARRFKFDAFSEAAQGVMRFVMQFAYLGYYSDPDVHHDIGYVPFSKRAPERGIPVNIVRRHAPLRVETPRDLDREGIDVIDDADVVIIGSGAAGSILAERLLEKGRRVLLLDKGKHLNPNDFSEDEVEMIGKLYGDNALQVTASLNFTILQGSCIGGTTVSNNAVSFETPPHVLERWNNEYQAQIDPDAYWASQAAVMRRLHIERVDATTLTRPAAEVMNPSSRLLPPGIDAVLRDRGYVYETVKANILDCLGCGYCNLGCRYGRKLSMLDEVLPKAQKDYGDALRILSEAEAVNLKMDGEVVESVSLRIGGRRTITIRRPKTVIVSGSAIASSWLLMRSGVGKHLPVGRRMVFNMGSPLHAVFPQVINAYDGLQISHHLQVEGRSDFIFETWFNPPVAQALVMPGWLDTHFRNMSRYNRMMAMGVVVPVDARDESHVRGSTFFPGTPEVVFRPTSTDLDRLLNAMLIIGEVLLASGAEEVMASTRRYHSYGKGRPYFRSSSDLSVLKQIVHDDKDLLLSSAHPQGGNPMGAVVDGDFRVKGYKNLYICDASVFPSSITVNPQLTVMNLAHYAADRIQ